jgi:hypothetical protein
VTLAATGWDVLWTLLPFLFLLGFWLYLSRNYRGAAPPTGQDALLEKLDEIRDELRSLRQAIEEKDSSFR